MLKKHDVAPQEYFLFDRLGRPRHQRYIFWEKNNSWWFARRARQYPGGPIDRDGGTGVGGWTRILRQEEKIK